MTLLDNVLRFLSLIFGGTDVRVGPGGARTSTSLQVTCMSRWSTCCASATWASLPCYLLLYLCVLPRSRTNFASRLLRGLSDECAALLPL